MPLGFWEGGSLPSFRGFGFEAAGLDLDIRGLPCMTRFRTTRCWSRISSRVSVTVCRTRVGVYLAPF